MPTLTAPQIAQQAAAAGFSGFALIEAVAIALAESSGNSDAVNPGTVQIPENSQGLWQINLNAHPQYSSPSILDPLTNAEAAFAVSSGGTNFNPWSTFTNGAYKQYINQATLAVASSAVNSVVGGVSTGVAQTTINTVGVAPPLPSLPNVGAAVASVTDPVVGAINNLSNTIGTGVNNATSGIEQLHNLVTWFGQSNLWSRIILVVVGFFVLLLGLALFGISLLPKGTRLPMVPA